MKPDPKNTDAPWHDDEKLTDKELNDTTKQVEEGKGKERDIDKQAGKEGEVKKPDAREIEKKEENAGRSV